MEQSGAPVTGEVAVFAGTIEGRVACARLLEAGVSPDVYVASDYGAAVLRDLCGLHVYVGRLCEDEMIQRLKAYRAVLDATHPYAAVVSANIEAACSLLAKPLVRVGRPRIAREDLAGVRVHVVENAREAALFLSKEMGNILLTTGSKDLPVWAADEQLRRRLWVRIIPDAENLRRALDLGLEPSHLICMQGPFSTMLNVALILDHDIGWVVTKDSGAAGGLPQKIEAARQTRTGLVLIARPEAQDEGLTVEEAVRRVIALVRGPGEQ